MYVMVATSPAAAKVASSFFHRLSATESEFCNVLLVN